MNAARALSLLFLLVLRVRVLQLLHGYTHNTDSCQYVLMRDEGVSGNQSSTAFWKLRSCAFVFPDPELWIGHPNARTLGPNITGSCEHEGSGMFVVEVIRRDGLSSAFLRMCTARPDFKARFTAKAFQAATLHATGRMCRRSPRRRCSDVYSLGGRKATWSSGG